MKIEKRESTESRKIMGKNEKKQAHNKIPVNERRSPIDKYCGQPSKNLHLPTTTSFDMRA